MHLSAIACLFLASSLADAQWRGGFNNQWQHGGNPQSQQQWGQGTQSQQQEKGQLAANNNDGQSTTTPLESSAFPQDAATNEGATTRGNAATRGGANTGGGAATNGGTATGGGYAAKGCGIWYDTGISKAVTQLGCTWAYSWGPEASGFDAGVPSGVEFVPMVSPKALTVAAAGIKSGSKHLLGWNEPNDSHLPQQQASAAWPALYNAWSNGGQPLVGSPAPANTALTPGDWFYHFMAAINNKVDFICLHHYASNYNDVSDEVTNLQNYIQRVYNMYKKPIWLTEFAMVAYGSDGSSFTVPSPAIEQQFLTQSIAMLKKLVSQGIVQRYAWFAVSASSAQPATDLVDSGVVNALGKAYQNV